MLLYCLTKTVDRFPKYLRPKKMEAEGEKKGEREKRREGKERTRERKGEEVKKGEGRRGQNYPLFALC